MVKRILIITSFLLFIIINVSYAQYGVTVQGAPQGAPGVNATGQPSIPQPMETQPTREIQSGQQMNITGQFSPEQVRIIQTELTKSGGALTQDAIQTILQRPEFRGMKSEDILKGKEQLERKRSERGIITEEMDSIFLERLKAWGIHGLKPFGYDFFREAAIKVVTDRLDIPVPSKYIVGPGDEVKILLWGRVNAQHNLIVDRNGNIMIPQIGPIQVAGMTFEDMSKHLIKQSEQIVGANIDITMGSLKTIPIFVLGDVRRPGAYTIGSFATVTDALLIAGGPSGIGSMRNIQLKRKDRVITTLDLYDLLLKGDKSKDIMLQAGDVVFVPVSGPIVGITGNVKRPAIYELKGETRLLDIIDMAGGLMGAAFKGRVQVQRAKEHKFWTIFEGDLIDVEKNKEKNFVLLDNDLIRIFSVTEARNIITVTGAIVNPGEYGIVPGVTKIKDIISLSGGLLYYASEESEITRVKATQEGPKTERIIVNLKKAVEGDPQHNIPLEINDYIFIRAVPEWRLYRTVDISGEVRYPGTYTIVKGETLSSLIERAGGYTDKAYLRGTVFIRESVREMQQKNLEELISRLEREIFSGGGSAMAAALSTEEIQAKKSELEQKQKFIDSLKRLRATGRMSIRLAHLRLLKGSEYDIELEEGDRLYIPKSNSVVGVSGSVMSQGSFIYSEKYTYKDYIAMAGGYSRFADEDNTYILKVDGSAIKAQAGTISWNPFKSRWEMTAFGETIKKIEPGDTIVVPEKIERIAWLREIKDITQVLANIALTAGIFHEVSRGGD